MILLPVVLKALLVIGAFGSGMVSHYLLKLPKNNVVEEMAEDVIKDNTGIEVDFSKMPDIPVPSCFDSQDDDK